MTKLVMEENFDLVAQEVQQRTGEGVAGLLKVHHWGMV